MTKKKSTSKSGASAASKVLKSPVPGFEVKTIKPGKTVKVEFTSSMLDRSPLKAPDTYDDLLVFGRRKAQLDAKAKRKPKA